MRYITFALAKGALQRSDGFIRRDRDHMRGNERRENKKINLRKRRIKIKIFLSKASDVPTYVEYGAADIGVVGKDTILEEGRNLYEVLDLKFGACKMCVCGPKEAKKYLNSNEIIRGGIQIPTYRQRIFQ